MFNFKKTRARRILAGFIVILLVIAMVVTFVASAFAATDGETVRDNVYIGSTYVGGMTRAQVQSTMDQYVDQLSHTQIVLRGDAGTVSVTAKDVGLSWDEQGVVDKAMSVGNSGNLIARYKEIEGLKRKSLDLPVGYKIDTVQFSFLLEAHQDELIDTSIVDWDLTREDGAFKIIEGKAGTKIDVDACAQKLIDYLNDEWDGGAIMLDLETTICEPKGSYEELSLVKDVLGTYSTDFGTNKNGRYYNVINGASLINGTLLYPGETFSTFETAGPLTLDNGYKVSTGYENGQVVDAVAGGICQVSTTLYNAVLLSELSVENRAAHSMLVSYVKPSMDAAIAESGGVAFKDFCFSNNTDAPIYIESYWSGGILTFTIYGHETRSAGHKVEYISEVTSQTPAGVTYTPDAAQPIGYVEVTQGAYPATVARLWKVVYENGAEVSRDIINNSQYRMSNKMVTIGVGTADPNAQAAVMNAIATGDEATIMATVAAYTVPVETPAQ